VVNVWDAGALLAGSGDAAALAAIERHQGAVRAVQFNPHAAAQHLLAAGSADGDISIINLDTPGQPTVAPYVPRAAGLHSAPCPATCMNEAIAAPRARPTDHVGHLPLTRPLSPAA
jgi:hypothetical protein